MVRIDMIVELVLKKLQSAIFHSASFACKPDSVNAFLTYIFPTLL